MIYHYAVIEDQPIFIADLRNRLESLEEFNFRFIDFNSTAETDFDTYISAFAESSCLPDVIFIDYDLDWRDGSKYNGKQVIQRIIELYPQKQRPYLIFISGPYVDQINKYSNDLRLTYGDLAISLDKSEYDDVPEGSNRPKLEIILDKAVENISLQRKKYGKIALNVHSYPDIQKTGLLTLGATFTAARKNLPFVIEIDNTSFGAIIFHTDYTIDLGLIVIIKENKPETYLMPLNRMSRARWCETFMKNGLNFAPQGKSIIYNPEYFYVNQDKKIDAKTAELKRKLVAKLLNEIELPNASPDTHPFLFALAGFAKHQP